MFLSEDSASIFISSDGVDRATEEADRVFSAAFFRGHCYKGVLNMKMKRFLHPLLLIVVLCALICCFSACDITNNSGNHGGSGNNNSDNHTDTPRHIDR